MTFKELQELQAAVKFDCVSMAACLGLDYEQYRRFYYGHTEIPEKVERAAFELKQMQKTFDIQRDEEYCDFLDTKYPQGFGEPIKLRPEPLNLS